MIAAWVKVGIEGSGRFAGGVLAFPVAPRISLFLGGPFRLARLVLLFDGTIRRRGIGFYIKPARCVIRLVPPWCLFLGTTVSGRPRLGVIWPGTVWPRLIRVGVI